MFLPREREIGELKRGEALDISSREFKRGASPSSFSSPSLVKGGG